MNPSVIHFARAWRLELITKRRWSNVFWILPSSRNLYVLPQAAPVSVFVELGNIQNTFDQRRLVMNSNRQALAKWLMEGFLKDYKEKK